jgi:hypothetical protein
MLFLFFVHHAFVLFSLAVGCSIELCISIIKIFVLFSAVVELNVQTSQIRQTLLETVLFYWR